MNTEQSFDLEKALKKEVAFTRDGRGVFKLKLATLDGKEALTGLVSREELRSYKKDAIISGELHVWPSLSGLGTGLDDLVDAPTDFLFEG